MHIPNDCKIVIFDWQAIALEHDDLGGMQRAFNNHHGIFSKPFHHSTLQCVPKNRQTTSKHKQPARNVDITYIRCACVYDFLHGQQACEVMHGFSNYFHFVKNHI